MNSARSIGLEKATEQPTLTHSARNTSVSIHNIRYDSETPSTMDYWIRLPLNFGSLSFVPTVIQTCTPILCIVHIMKSC